MLKRQAKEQKIRRMLKKVNIDKLKIVILKNCSKKTYFEVKNQILFVNPSSESYCRSSFGRIDEKNGFEK